MSSINLYIYLYIWSTSQQACHTTSAYNSRTRLLFAVINWRAHADRDCYCVGLGLQTCTYIYAVVDDIGRHNSYTVPLHTSSTHTSVANLFSLWYMTSTSWSTWEDGMTADWSCCASFRMASYTQYIRTYSIAAYVQMVSPWTHNIVLVHMYTL